MIKTKRWNAPREADDGYRLLVSRYRPRGVRKALEPWDAWNPHLGPSRQLHAKWYGKRGAPISWNAYAQRFRTEMHERQDEIRQLAERSRRGETITLLCFCADERHCHRTLLAELINSIHPQ